jgi:tyrosyl-tRNA synthetase
MMFTELTYQLLQAYDFYWLHRNQGCTIQIGGADQWGNILAGCDFIGRKLRFEQTTTDPGTTTPHAYGIVTSLLTTASGVKIGKSAGNAVWLDKTMTSIYNFYQVSKP